MEEAPPQTEEGGTTASGRVMAAGFGLCLAAVAYGLFQNGSMSTAEGRTWLFLGGGGVMQAIPLLLVLAGRRIAFMKDLGFLSGNKGTALAWVLGIGFAAGFVAYSIWGHRSIILQHMFEPSALRGMAVFTAVSAGTLEEVIFRRLVMDQAKRFGGGRFLQVLASAICFGLPHAMWGLGAGSWQVALGAVIATALMGLALGIVYLAGRRSLAPCIASHVLITLLIEPGLFVAAMGV